MSGKRGRPSSYSVAKSEEICRRIAEGEPLRQICRDDAMPQWQTVYRWMAQREDFRNRIACAREAGFDAIAEGTLEIADDARNDWMDAIDGEGQSAGYKLNGEHVQRSKLRIETRLKLLAKWSPKKYGEKTAIEHSGSIGLESLVAGDE